MGVIGQQIKMGLYGKRQMSPAKNGQVVKPQEPTSLNAFILTPMSPSRFQFEENTLEIVLHLLEKSGIEQAKMGDPVLISRMLSAMVCMIVYSKIYNWFVKMYVSVRWSLTSATST